MPPFQCETTTDLHYGVVVNSIPKLSPLETTEASTSPLLLDTEIKNRKDSIQAEHEQFEQEAQQVRRSRFNSCCFKILLTLSMIPTLCLFPIDIWIVASPLMIVVFVGLWMALMRSPAALSPSLVRAVLIWNVVTLCWIFHEQLWDGWIVGGAGMIDFMALFYYYKVCQSKPVLEHGKLRQKELFFTYMGTIKSVAENVCNNNQQETPNNPQASTELREFYKSSPSEGFYNDHSSQLFLLFPPSNSPKGWCIRGARKAKNGDRVQSIVLEGFVSPTYEAYWTEGTLDGKENILYYGKFAKHNQFTGEWLSYKGKRCQQYNLKLASPAHTDKHLGVFCNACGRAALPGMCYLAKNRKCCYCQACAEDDITLMKDEEEFVGLQLPGVARCKTEDQLYDPPTSDSFRDDLELGDRKSVV